MDKISHFEIDNLMDEVKFDSNKLKEIYRDRFIVYEYKNSDVDKYENINKFYIALKDNRYNYVYFEDEQINRIYKKNGKKVEVVCINKIEGFEKGINYYAYDDVKGFYLVENMNGDFVLSKHKNFVKVKPTRNKNMNLSTLNLNKHQEKYLIKEEKYLTKEERDVTAQKTAKKLHEIFRKV